MCIRVILPSIVIGLLLGWSAPLSAAAPFPGDLPPASAIAWSDLAVDDDEKDDDKKKDDEKKDGADEKKDEKLTLEKLFPEKSHFGPSARSMSFSHDGRFGAYLYRPYPERRHGNDLYLYDAATGETRRVTKATILAPFQKSTRKVTEDREKKAKKAKKGARSGDASGTDKKKAAGGADPVSGIWEGTVNGPEEMGFPPDGLAFTLRLRKSADDSVSGELQTSMARASFDGEYDAKTGRLTGELTGEESEFGAMLEVTIADGAITGDIRVAVFAITMKLEGLRTGDLEDAGDEDEDEDEDEGDDDGESDDDGDAEESDEKTDTDTDTDDEDKDKDKGKDEDEDEDEDKDKDKTELGDTVGEKDADDRSAPRYGGVQSYVWSPDADEMIFTSGSDLYRYELDGDHITRLTRTRDPEVEVQYLPDGSGYTYLRVGQRGNALMRVSFGSHLQEQLDPALPDNESMASYRISPDGKRIVLLTTKGSSYWGAGRTVKIVNYRGRFAQVRDVARHMPDDPLPEYEWRIHLYEIEDFMAEEGELKRVFSHKQSGPRDIMKVPEWAPDSSRVAFAVFEQSSGHVQILEARFKEDEDADETEAAEETKADDADKDDEKKDGEKKDGEKKKDGEDDSKIEEARIVYTFFHNGGPNTPGMVRPYYLPDSRRLAFITEQSGFRHVHVLDPLYEALNQLTAGSFEVYPFDLSEDHQTMFVTATLPTAAHLTVFAVDLESGDMTPLTETPGFYSSPAVSDDGGHVLAGYVTFGQPRELVAVEVDAATMTPLTDSHPDKTKKIVEPMPEFFTYENRHGHEIHGTMFKPDGWSEDDERPLLIYVYGGPLRTQKMVVDGSYAADSYFFAYYMAKKHGYVTCTVDPRGCSGYGGLFEKSNFEQVGRPQVEDLVDFAKYFSEHCGVDEKRIGLHGWSFGGFQTQMCLYTEPDVFACGIAGAGPTEWENYNSWYSTGTIGANEPGKTDLKKFSLLPLAKNLKAKLLLVHGMEDSNVLYQDTVRVYRELLKANKETLVELFLDPTGGHGLGGDVKRINRSRKYEEFLLRVLGEGPVPDAEGDAAKGDEKGADEEDAKADG